MKKISENTDRLNQKGFRHKSKPSENKYDRKHKTLEMSEKCNRNAKI